MREKPLMLPGQRAAGFGNLAEITVLETDKGKDWLI